MVTKNTNPPQENSKIMDIEALKEAKCWYNAVGHLYPETKLTDWYHTIYEESGPKRDLYFFTKKPEFQREAEKLLHNQKNKAPIR